MSAMMSPFAAVDLCEVVVPSVVVPAKAGTQHSRTSIADLGVNSYSRCLLGPRFSRGRQQWSLSHQPARRWREQLIDRHRLADDALLQRMPDQLVEHPAVRRDAVRQRLAGDLHHPLMHL